MSAAPPSPAVCRTPGEVRSRVRSWRAQGLTVGFVPTMGALHHGHLSLVRRALEEADRVVASVYVNPTQFAPGEDFDAYPRDTEDDLGKLARAGCHLAYLPDTADMYPEGNLTEVRVPDLSDVLDGLHRPHFFYGVATVVCRLLIHVAPDVAVFGEKDFQQLAVVKRMVRDLGFAVSVVGAPTGRAADGLALSSRNAYLTSQERRAAGALPRALVRCARRLKAGAAAGPALADARAALSAAGFRRVDYVTLADADDLSELGELPACGARLLAAAWLGKARLIDNLAVGAPS